MIRRELLLGCALLALATPAWAQAPQLTNDDLLKLIGVKEVQQLQCGKALEAAQQEIAKMKAAQKPTEQQEQGKQ